MVRFPAKENHAGGIMANRRITKKRKKQLEQKAMEAILLKAEEISPRAKAEKEPEEQALAAKTRSKNMKSRFFVQYNGHEFEEQEILAKIKQKWKEAGNMVKDLKDLDIYVKPEDGKAYYRINGEISGNMPLYE
jgi:hypothetical protein